MPARAALLAEIVVMALDTLRANKLRSALTILGVVIGVTSVVAMTALVRGFGDRLHALIQELGSDTVIVQKFGFATFASGRDFLELMKRPDLTEADVDAIRESVPSAQIVTYQLGDALGAVPQRVTYRGVSTKRLTVMGTDEDWLRVNLQTIDQGRYFTDVEFERRRQVVVLGSSPAAALFPRIDPVGKQVRVGRDAFTVIGVLAARPGLLGDDPNAIVVMPATTYTKKYPALRVEGVLMRLLTISVVPRRGSTREQLMRDLEELMRSRHHLRLDEPNDFDLSTADSVNRALDELTKATVLTLIVISSIALMVGGIGVMAIMTISVTERTREIGLRKAIGATRRGILVQFLVEAVVLTLAGGLLGIALGAGVGLLVSRLADFPVSLPIWSFALGLGFSTSVGVFFGFYPALRASRLDAIDALRYE